MPGGPRGPVPKRSDQRRRRNTDGGTVDQAPAGQAAASTTAPPPQPDWGTEAVELYESFGASGQSAFYEPSDWHMLRLACQMVDGLYRGGRPSAQMLAAVLSLFSSLLATEGDRRRLRLELQREEPAEPASVAILAKYRSAAGSGGK